MGIDGKMGSGVAVDGWGFEIRLLCFDGYEEDRSEFMDPTKCLYH